MRVEERGLLGGDDEVDLPQQVEGAAACHAVDGTDDRLPQVARLRAEVFTRIVEHEGRGTGSYVHGFAVLAHRVVTGGLAQGLVAVDTGAERLVAGSGQDDRPHVVVAPKGPPQGAELALHDGVEGVVDLGPIEGDPGDAVGLLVAECLEGGDGGHGGAPGSLGGVRAGTRACAVACAAGTLAPTRCAPRVLYRFKTIDD